MNGQRLVATLTAMHCALAPVVAGGSCSEGGCANVAPDPCWEIVSQQCIATPGPASFTQGAAISMGAGDAIDCNACALDEGEGVVHISVGQETGLSFCITLEAGVSLTAGASLCGVGLTGEMSASVGTQYCVNTKRWVDHEVECRCAAGSLVHCRTMSEVVPIRITVPVEYSLATCYQRRRPPSPSCEALADGSTGFTQLIFCGMDVQHSSDTRLKITAAFVTGECPPSVDADLPIVSLPKGGPAVRSRVTRNTRGGTPAPV